MTGGDVTIVDPLAISTASDDGQGDAQLNVTYTVTDAVVGADHSIELFAADNVTVDADGVVTFVAPTTGTLADPGTVDGTLFDIVSINGDTAAASGTQVQGFRPNSDTFTFTVQVDDASANVLGSVVPVVYFDDADGGFTGGVEVDADGVPADDALFGVGGQIEVLPVELATGALAGNATIDVVDTERDILVITTFGGDVVHVSYAATDDFFVNPGGTAAKATAAHESDLAGFEARVAVGDELVGPSETVYSRTGVSEFVLADIVPGAVAGLAASAVSDTEIDLTAWNDANADSYTVYRAAGDDLENDGAGNLVAADEAAFSEIGTVAGDDDREFTDTGLAADTTYVYWVTATIDGVEGVFSTGAIGGDTVAVDTLLEGEVAALISELAFMTDSASIPAGTVSNGDTIVVAFNDAVTTGVAAEIAFRNAEGNVFNVPVGDIATSTAAFTFEGTTYAAGEVLVITVSSAAGSYPLEIVASAEITNASGAWDLDGSSVTTVTVNTTLTAPA